MTVCDHVFGLAVCVALTVIASNAIASMTGIRIGIGIAPTGTGCSNVMRTYSIRKRAKNSRTTVSMRATFASKVNSLCQ